MHSSAVSDAASYDSPGIPWVSYFTGGGIAIHGTYRHDDYSMPRSHGCVNATLSRRQLVLALGHATQR